MTALRALLALAVGVLVTLTTLAFSVQQSLTDPTGFATSMTSALERPAVEAEVQSEIREEVRKALERIDPESPVNTIVTAIGAETIAAKAAETTDSDGFPGAWHDWSLLVFSGMADQARGRANPDVQFGSNTMTVAVAPLIEPILGQTLTGGVAGILDVFDAKSTVTIDTGAPTELALTTFGRLAEWRWFFLLAAAGCLLLLIANRRAFRWLAIAALLAAAGCALSGLGAYLAETRPAPDSQFPQLGMAVMQALSAHWDRNLFLVGAACALVAALAFVADAVRTRRRTPVRIA